MPARLSSMDLLEDNTLTANGDAPAEDDHTSNRRRSGRVMKKREVFKPAAQEAQGGGRGKRKRAQQGADNNENDDPEGDPAADSDKESNADEGEDEADAEDVTEKRRKAKAPKTAKKPRGRPAAKKAKTTAPKTSVLPLRTVPRKPQVKPRSARGKGSSPADTAQGLYGMLSFHRFTLWLPLKTFCSRRLLKRAYCRVDGCRMDLKISKR